MEIGQRYGVGPGQSRMGPMGPGVMGDPLPFEDVHGGPQMRAAGAVFPRHAPYGGGGANKLRRRF